MGKENLPKKGNSPASNPVKKVVPINTPQDTGPESAGPTGGGSNGTIFGKMRDFMSQAANSVSGAAINGLRGAKNSWFGIKPIGQGISNGVGKAAGFLNISKKAMAIALAVTMVGGVGAGTIAIVNNQQTNLIIRQEDYYDDCADKLEEANKKQVTTPAGDVSAQQQECAEKMWALGKALGMTDEQCAGMLGNMQQESGIDPTTVEGIYNEPFQIGTRKAALMPEPDPLPNNAMNAWFETLVGMYARNGITLSRSGYQYDGVNYCCGLGLIQWTGPTGKHLVDTAAANGKKWYDLDLQCAAMIGNEPSRLQGFLNDRGNSSSVEAATGSWLGFMERGVGHAVLSGYQYENRANYAKDWYARFSSQSSSIAAKWKDFANDVISMAGTVAGAATGKHAKEVEEECGGTEPAPDNGTLADAAVAYAWETKEMGMGNDGTQLYHAVKDAVAPDDTWIYQSCDRGVATAVRWSGADDNFPMGSTTEQDSYLSSHPELWQFVGEYDSHYSELEPGDIVITTNVRRGSEHGHIVMFVGNEAVRKKYPNSDAEFVSASYLTRSPGCGDHPPAYVGDGYHIYRYIGNYDGQLKNAYNGSASGTS